MRILLVEDDELLGSAIQDALTRGAYGVEWVRDGSAAYEALKTGGFDLVVLDLGLPKLDGLTLLRRIRGDGAQVAVLVVSARDRATDRVTGLDAGADDYLVKPFELDELFARVRAVQRRMRGAAVNLLELRDVRVDPVALTVTHRGQAVSLQRREFMVLRKLMENAGHVLTRAQLEEAIYGWDGNVESNALDVHIYNLRRKLDPDFIRTVRGVGYIVDTGDPGRPARAGARAPGATGPPTARAPRSTPPSCGARSRCSASCSGSSPSLRTSRASTRRKRSSTHGSRRPPACSMRSSRASRWRPKGSRS
jgi:two-component system response regulator QseB